MRNNWVLTDPDCRQYMANDDNKYKMIQYVELDLTETDIENGVNKFIVCFNDVDLHRLSNDDVCSHISSYGYSFINLIETYGNSALGIIAECVLENSILDNSNIIAEFRSEKEAVGFIENYIEIDNYTNV